MLPVSNLLRVPQQESKRKGVGVGNPGNQPLITVISESLDCHSEVTALAGISAQQNYHPDTAELVLLCSTQTHEHSCCL